MGWKHRGAAPLFESTDQQGHFSVTALETGAHQVCLLNGESPKRSVKLHMRTAVEVDNHELVAKKEHVEAIEAELDRMERMAVHVYEEMSYMRSRSDATRALDESTRGRLMWVEIAMVCTLLVMGAWQIHYLKRYFKAKKIL